jgi:hypothetical protein
MLGDRQITDGTRSYYLEEEGENSDLFLSQIKKDLLQKLVSKEISTDGPARIDALRK